MDIQVLSGNILMIPSGQIAGECCCSEEILPCPTVCTSCPTSLTAVVSGIGDDGSCSPDGDCTDANGSYALDKELDAESCGWVDTNPPDGILFAGVSCTNYSGEGSWGFNIHVFNKLDYCDVEYTSPNTSNCPPTGSWDWNAAFTLCQEGSATFS